METNRILLVDDEQDIREVLEISLADMGYQVYQAENGLDALELFRRADPPVVLTDIKMPGMDGIELLRRIKQENPDTEVVMITGHGDMDLAIKSLKFQASDFITKPINVDALEIALKRVSDKMTMRRKLQEYMQHLEALVQEKSELQSHLASLGLMIGSISHGIKGLLTGLDGGLYLLDSGMKHGDLDQGMEGLEIVKSLVDRIRKMVLDILFYAKERKLDWQEVAICPFAGEVAAVVASKMARLDIEFEKEFDSALGTTGLDKECIRSAMINILDNAIDACEKEMSGRRHKIVFRVCRRPGHVRFEVEDNGVGMDADTREKIFRLFFFLKGKQRHRFRSIHRQPCGSAARRIDHGQIDPWARVDLPHRDTGPFAGRDPKFIVRCPTRSCKKNPFCWLIPSTPAKKSKCE